MAPSREDLPLMLTPAQVEREYGFDLGTLRQWRYRGGGPRFFKTSPGKGGHVRYRRTDIEAWIDERTFDSDPAEAA